MADPNQDTHLGTHRRVVTRRLDTNLLDTHRHLAMHHPVCHRQEATMEGRHQVAAATMVGLQGHQVALLQVAVGDHHLVPQKANGRFQRRRLTTTALEEVVVAHQLMPLEALTHMPIPLLHLLVVTTVEVTPMQTAATQTKVVLFLEHPVAGLVPLRLMVRREVARPRRLVHIQITTEAVKAASAAAIGAAAAMTTTDPQAIHAAHLQRNHAVMPVDIHHPGPQQHRLGRV